MEKVFEHKKNTKVKQPSVFLEKVREHFILNLQISTDVVCFLAFIENIVRKKVSNKYRILMAR